MRKERGKEMSLMRNVRIMNYLAIFGKRYLYLARLFNKNEDVLELNLPSKDKIIPLTISICMG